MTIPKQSNISTHQSYCLNIDCQQPENLRDAVTCKSCDSPLILHQRYRAIKPIGRGGFGRTFLAIATSQNPESQQSESFCVIKQFFPQQQGNRLKASELFRQEAERLRTLGNHVQIPKLLDYFELTPDDHPQGNLYLVQEFIDGRNLAQGLAEEGVFDQTKIRELLDSLLPILAFIHSHQVIHRDIKPENIVRRSAQSSIQTEGGKEELVLVDFGSAKYATETKLAKTGTMIGSAAYTAPEQVLGKADFSSDIYSLGVTCIHLLTGISPFNLFDSKEHTWIWRDYLRLVEKENHQKSPSTGSIDNLPLSEHLGQILDRMLCSATNKRFRSANAVIEALNLRSQPEVILKLKRRIKPKWLVIGTMLILGFGSVRAATVPVTQMVTAESRVVAKLVTDPTELRDDLPNVGSLYSADDKQVFPLKHTEVMAKVAGNVSRVEVTQTFENPLKQPLEAIYVFPLPDQAAVDDMEIKVGDRTIRGFIKKREEAKQIFNEAKRAGKTAGLLEQERDNIFTQSLANIKPGEKIEVKIRYTESLKFEKGSYEFVFPMVVGPRYIPNNVADATKITAPMQPSSTRSGQDIGVTVEIEAGVPLSNMKSTSHQIRTIQNGGVTRVTLDPQDTIPNKDLILRYQVSGNDTQNTVLAQADRRGGHFATYLIPALKYQSDRIVPKDVVFLMDTSGSQSGEPLAQSKQLMYRFIKGLNPNDTFTIIDFSNTATQLSDLPLENTQSNRDLANEYVDRLEANGGTELMNGIEAVLKFPAAKEGRLRSIVLLTDGFIGNDEQIIGEVRDRLQAGNRLYTFGVGSSVNRFLIERLSQLGRGTAQVVRQNEPIAPVVEKFFQQINNPVLTNIAVKWEGTGAAPEMYPARPSDLFANQPLVLFGRKGDRTSGNLQITGMVAGGKPYTQTIPVNFTNGGNMAIAQLWGRARIQELMNQMYNIETTDGIAAVTKTALEYNLLSKYTAFVAVTDEVRVEPKIPTTTLNVPVPNPQGVANPANIVPTTVPTANANLNDNGEVPEPEQIFGTLAGILLLIGALLRKRLGSPKKS
jgi:Ca-activated chloride channel family protein